jgi:trimeric autotransporter adhesin
MCVYQAEKYCGNEMGTGSHQRGKTKFQMMTRRITLFILTIIISSQAFAQVPAYVSSTGLLAWYRFSGNTNNSFAGNNGTAYGGVTFGTDRTGAVNSAYIGNGASGVDIHGNNFPSGNASRSVAAWFKSVLPYPGGQMEIFATGDTNAAGNLFGLYTDGTNVGFESAGSTVSHPFVIDSAWHHLAVTYPASGAGTASIKVYLDGELVSTNVINPLSVLTTDTGNIHAIGTLLMPAYAGGWGNSWTGRLDDIGVWNRELTPCEVRQLYFASVLVPVGTITGTAAICPGTTTTLSDTVAGGVWTSSNSAIATIDSAGTVNGITPGTSIITYSLGGACRTVRTVSVLVIPTTVSPITGPLAVCSGSSITMSDATPGGTWSSSNTAVATIGTSRVVTGVSPGTTTISYTIANICGSVTDTQSITVNLTPSAITGTTVFCQGASTTLSDPTAGGTWSSGATAIATIDSITGLVKGVGAGTALISYSMPGGCKATAALTINPNPGAYFVTGGGNYCFGYPGVHIYLTGSAAGIKYQLYAGLSPRIPIGAPWFGTGLPMDLGLQTLSNVYTVMATNVVTSCTSQMYGSAIVTQTTLPPALPILAGTITGPSHVCIGASITLTDTTASVGGYWWSTNFKAVIYDNLTVTGLVKGLDTISFVALNFCGSTDTAIATQVITIDSLPVVGVITGPASVCTGNTISLSDTTAGGTWTSSNNSVATVSATGVVTGVSAGTAAISYTVFNLCGPSVVVKTVTVNPLPAAITGTLTVCPGAATALTDATTGGSWSSGATTIATVGAGTGVVRGVTAGTAPITYTSGPGCKISTIVTVNPFPNAGVINGIPSVCIGTSITLSDTSAGGTWSSGNTGIATADATSGTVTGVALGTVTISYTVSNSCGTAIATKLITVILVPFAGTITGPTFVCTGASVTLSDIAAGGIWTSSNTALATIDPFTGIVFGDSVGRDTITYTVTNSCGTAITSRTINVLPSPSPILGFTIACPGSTTALFDTTAGGVWSDPGYETYATIDTSGIVAGIATGSAVISYTIPTGCMATTTVAIPSLPYSGIVTGLSYLCAGARITLTDTVTGGSWSSSNASVASVSPAGIVHGLSSGTSSISYTVINACGTATTIHPVNIYPSANPGAIIGNSNVCIFSVDTLVDAILGGTWSSSNPSVVTVNSTGIITAVGAGTAIISYGVSNFCGPSYATKTINVFLPTSVGPILGPASVCVGDTMRLRDSVAGGVWSSSNTTLSINPFGFVTGIRPGTTIITYNNSNVCNQAVATETVTINPRPEAGFIVRGLDSVCVGDTIRLTDTIPGGVWTSNNGNAIVDSVTGVITGVSAGTDVITYSVTNMCGTDTATRRILVKAIDPAGIIQGLQIVCRGDSITLSDTTLGGVWTSGSPGVASVDSGVVTAISYGTSIISYSITSYCGTATATHTVYVPPLPASINGTFHVCEGNTLMVGDLSGGTWHSSNTAVATVVTGTGLVYGVSPGTAVILYNMDLGCSGTTTVNVLPAPDAGTISVPPVTCNTSSFTLGETVPGGRWSLDNTSFATIDSVTGTINSSAAGTVMVTYMSPYNAVGCRRAATYSLTLTHPDSLGISPVAKNDVCDQGIGSIHIDISGGTPPYSALWQTGVLGNDYTALHAGTYTVTVKDRNSCTTNFSVSIGDDDCGGVTIHDVITPNGDGVNDVWIIEGIQNYPNSIVQVYDKWGDKLYETHNYNNDWNGKKTTGELLPDGTYFYIVKLNVPAGTNIRNVWTGSILVKR